MNRLLGAAALAVGMLVGLATPANAIPGRCLWNGIELVCAEHPRLYAKGTVRYRLVPEHAAWLLHGGPRKPFR